MSLMDSSVVVEKNSTSVCAMEGSHITYHCKLGLVPSEMMMSICMEDGTWSPNPGDLICNPIERSNCSGPPKYGMYTYQYMIVCLVQLCHPLVLKRVLCCTSMYGLAVAFCKNNPVQILMVVYSEWVLPYNLYYCD